MKLDKDKKIAYVEHPVTAEKVQELRRDGYEVLDVLFAPAGLDDVGADNERRRGRKPKEPDALNIQGEDEAAE